MNTYYLLPTTYYKGDPLHAATCSVARHPDRFSPSAVRRILLTRPRPSRRWIQTEATSLQVYGRTLRRATPLAGRQLLFHPVCLSVHIPRMALRAVCLRLVEGLPLPWAGSSK